MLPSALTHLSKKWEVSFACDGQYFHQKVSTIFPSETMGLNGTDSEAGRWIIPFHTMDLSRGPCSVANRQSENICTNHKLTSEEYKAHGSKLPCSVTFGPLCFLKMKQHCPIVAFLLSEFFY